MPTSEHRVSVILLTKNSASTVQKSLDSIFHQTRKPDEVVVVDGSSADGTLEVVKNYPVKLVAEPGLGFGHARNLGVKNSTGDVVFFLDSDCYAEPGWIEKALTHFDSGSEIAGVTGQTRLWNTESGVARFLACVGGRVNMPKQRRYVKVAPTMNLALRRSVVDEVGGFDETLVRCEDTDLTYKVSRQHRILYEPEAVVWFRGSPSLSVASHKCLRHFTGVGQLFAKHGFNPSFARFNLPVRCVLIVTLMLSLFLLPWYVSVVLFSLLLAEFLYKTVRMYVRYRDGAVVYYVVFFTLWSLLSLAMFYGLYLGWRNKHRSKETMSRV